MNGEKLLFRVGTLPTCPRQNIALGGVSFPRYTEKVDIDSQAGSTTRSRTDGCVIELTRSQVARCQAAIADRVSRKNNTRGSVLLRSSGRYVPHPVDEPLAQHVYMVYLGPAKGTFDEPLPPSFADAPPVLPSEEMDSARETEARAEPDDAARRERHRAAKRSGDKVDPFAELAGG